jgi:TRAP-type C4-dicarboxylate transport system substrate-binding protein
MPFYISAQLLLINKDTYEGMPEDLRQVLDDHCTPEWSKRFSTGWAENEASGRQKMVDDAEHVLYQPTEAEVQLWQEAAAPLIDQWKADANAAGVDADAVYDSYIEALERHDARF